jgi:hypothetical protein
MDVEQVVVLNLSDTGRNASHTRHRLGVRTRIFEARRRENLQCDRHGELIGTAKFAQINHALSARPKQSQKHVVRRPVQLSIAQNVVVVRDEFIRRSLRLVSTLCQRGMQILVRRGGHETEQNAGC